VSRKRAPRLAPPSGREEAATATPPSSASDAFRRVPALDALRGVAILAMVAYHFSFDLAFFRMVQWDLYHDPFWLIARTTILSSFLLIAGVSLVLADRNRTAPVRFWRHVGIIGACALAVSVSSYSLFPDSWIWFGVLHAIAVSLVLARPLASRPVLALVIGVGVIAAGNLFAHPAFDNRWLGWIGFMTAKPRTEDYVPLFPWFGVLLLGIAAGHALVRRDFRPIAFAGKLPGWFGWLGRHSLAIYMIHQPLLIALLYLLVGR
jgi:uncharacterized membrane protein